jgi:hypothetical protein
VQHLQHVQIMLRTTLLSNSYNGDPHMIVFNQRKLKLQQKNKKKCLRKWTLWRGTMNNPFYSETLMKYMGGLKLHLMTLSYTPNYQCSLHATMCRRCVYTMHFKWQDPLPQQPR